MNEDASLKFRLQETRMLDNVIQRSWKLAVERLYHIVPWLDKSQWLKRQGAWLRNDGDFSSLLRFQTGPEVHSTSYKMSTGGFPGCKGEQALD